LLRGGGGKGEKKNLGENKGRKGETPSGQKGKQRSQKTETPRRKGGGTGGRDFATRGPKKEKKKNPGAATQEGKKKLRGEKPNVNLLLK